MTSLTSVGQVRTACYIDEDDQGYRRDEGVLLYLETPACYLELL